MKVLIADKIEEKGISILEEFAEVSVQTDITNQKLIRSIGEFDAVVVRSRTKITREAIESASRLKLIARAGVGVDNIDVEAATERGIMVVNAPESASVTVAELTLGIIITLTRKISQADKSVKEGKWEKSKFMGVELFGKTLGIIGMGRIGEQVAARLKSFQMKILAYDPYITEDTASKLGVTLVELDTLLKEADIVTIHVPLTPQTRHFIARKELELMKENAFLINCARGGIVDEHALYDALSQGKIAGAGMDVYENEPPTGNPLLDLDNVVATPHIGASTREAQQNAAIIVAEEIKKVFNGEAPSNLINLPVLDSERQTAK
ncbi:MAG: phosphoglycerate dehydrogenase [Methanobacteriaceae archaeon]|nr:phosphoglycerate dehydrogenase [Methanobacteriaceae archaeon]